MNRALNRYPFGIFLRFQEHKNLLNTTETQIQVASLNEQTKQLQEIKNKLQPWNQRAISGMRYALIASILLLGFSLLIGNYQLIPFVVLALQPYILTYALQGTLGSMRQYYQDSRHKKLLTENVTLLCQLSQQFNLPDWILRQTSNEKTGFFVLPLENYSYKINGENSVSRKVLSAIIINVLKENKIHAQLLNHLHPILSSNITLNTSIINQVIKEIEKQLNTHMKLIASKKAFELQVNLLHNEISKQCSNIKCQKINTSLSNQYAYDYLFDMGFIDKKNEPQKNSLKNLFITLYGQERVEDITVGRHEFIKIIAGKIANKDKLESCISTLSSYRFSYQTRPCAFFSESSSISTSRRKVYHGKGKGKAARRKQDLNPEKIISNVAKTIDFGVFGKYSSDDESCQIKEISAPYWPSQSHFMLFKAPANAFPSQAQYEKFKNLRPHIVNGKKQKGLVPTSGLLNIGPKCSKLKMKDPSEDLRVYDQLYEVSTPDRKKAHLHVFEEVVLHAHKSMKR